MPSIPPLHEGVGASVGAAASALFAEIRDGGDNIAARLRHVREDEKTYKRSAQHGAVDFSALDAKRAEAEARRQRPGGAEWPLLQLEGDKRWVVRHQKGTTAEPKQVELNDVHMRHAVQIQNCESARIEIKGKVNSVSIVSCGKVQVVLESVVSSLEVLQSENIDVKVHRAVPTATIEKSASVNLYLMDKSEALNTEVVTACSTTVNVNFPLEEDASEIIERPIPEQFVSKIVCDKRGGYKIETKPTDII